MFKYRGSLSLDGFNVNVRRQGTAASDKGRCEQSVVNVEVSWAGQRNLS